MLYDQWLLTFESLYRGPDTFYLKRIIYCTFLWIIDICMKALNKRVPIDIYFNEQKKEIFP